MSIKEKINSKLKGYKKVLFLFLASYVYDLIANRNKKVRIKENKKNRYIENVEYEVKDKK